MKNKKVQLSKVAIKRARKNFIETWKLLEKNYPDAHCALNFKNPLQLLIATILSAQCTDKRVNMVTPILFEKYQNAYEFASAKQEDLEKIIHSTGFYRNKAKSILGATKIIAEQYQGEVPQNMDQLLELPGVARKTANVVLWNAFGKNEGVVVDTHVGRISYRLGWTDQINVAKIEQDLIKLIPRENWGIASHLLIDLGRDVCKAPTPNCGPCAMKNLCPWFQEIENKKPLKFPKPPKTHQVD